MFLEKSGSSFRGLSLKETIYEWKKKKLKDSFKTFPSLKQERSKYQQLLRGRIRRRN